MNTKILNILEYLCSRIEETYFDKDHKENEAYCDCLNEIILPKLPEYKNKILELTPNLYLFLPEGWFSHQETDWCIYRKDYDLNIEVTKKDGTCLAEWSIINIYFDNGIYKENILKTFDEIEKAIKYFDNHLEEFEKFKIQ